MELFGTPSYNNRYSAQLTVTLLMHLVICNFGFLHSRGWKRLIWNAAGYGGLLIISRAAQLDKQSVGLSPATIRSGLRYALYTNGLIMLLLISVFLINKSVFQDSRYRQSISAAIYASTVVLPLKTVIFEELAFRGILPSILLHTNSDRRLVGWISAAAFGLWHITSASSIDSPALPKGVRVPKLLIISAVVITTTLFGFVLLQLRWLSGSLFAAIATHWFISGFGMILAALSWR